MKWLYCSFVLLALAGCDGGGGSANGREVVQAIPAGSGEMLVSGIANKGPFERGAMIRLRKLGAANALLTRYTTGDLGQFSVPLADGQGYLVEATGRYFSEFAGAMSETPLTLRAVVRGGAGEGVNVNLATHLAHRRVLALLASGASLEEAIAMAETEMIEALRPVMVPPAHALRFARLAVINGLQAADNEEGNAWLLAVTSILEQAAARAAAASGVGVPEELVALCERIARDLEDDGVISDELLAELRAARAQLDPDRVGSHLLRAMMATLAHADLAQRLGNFGAWQPRVCAAVGDDAVCADATSMPAGSQMHMMLQLRTLLRANVATAPLERMIANMNRFIDTDGDGIVNADDEDDDNDGIPDAEDDTPYGA